MPPARRLPDDLVTQRLVLQRLTERHLDDLVRLCADEQVMALTGGVRSAEQTRQWLAEQIAHWNEHGFGRWALRDRASGVFIGRGGLRRVVVEGQDEIDLGYSLFPEYWGRGLAVEVAREALRTGFEVLRLPSIVAVTQPHHHRSRRVMERAGLRYERDCLWADLPHVLYRARQSEW